MALRAGDEALQPLDVVEARALIDIGVELEKPSDRDGVVREARQELRNDRKDLRCLLGRNLAADPDLDFALLPLPEAVWPDERQKGAAGPEMLFQPRLPGLPGRKGIAVEEGAKSGLLEARAQRVRTAESARE